MVAGLNDTPAFIQALAGLSGRGSSECRGSPSARRLRLIQPTTETMLPTVHTTTTPIDPLHHVGLSPLQDAPAIEVSEHAEGSESDHPRRPGNREQTLARILERRRAITNGVNGKGGGAIDAITSAHAALSVTFRLT